MLTPGSLRAEAIKACFMEAGFTNSRLRTVLQDRRGQAVFLWICWCHIPKLQIQDTAGGEMRDELVCVWQCVCLVWEKWRDDCCQQGEDDVWFQQYELTNGFSYSSTTRGHSETGTHFTAASCRITKPWLLNQISLQYYVPVTSDVNHL